MQKLCSKLILVKAGSRIITTDNSELCEFELLEDLQVNVECVEYFNAEKIAVLPSTGGTEV